MVTYRFTYSIGKAFSCEADSLTEALIKFTKATGFSEHSIIKIEAH